MDNGVDYTVSVIVPTYREAQNLSALIERVGAVRRETGLALQLLIMDDNSQDGTAELIATREESWVTLVTRTRNRGLSQAVCEGLSRTKSDFLVVMDADLSHPPEIIPLLVAALKAGADFAIGSRYIKGGSTAIEWGVFRWLNSRVATWLARPFTNAADPMSGFFALRRETYERGAGTLNPIGYKIGLELIVKCACRHIQEVPIHFADRQHGESKMTLSEQLRYLRHLRLLLIHKYGTWSHLLQFLVVGGMGTVVNILVLTLLLAIGMVSNLAIAVAIGVSMVFNFALNRRFTFAYARRHSLLPQFVGFLATCSLGACVNFIVAISVLAMFPWLFPQIAALCGIAVGTGINFLMNRFLVFRSYEL